MPEAALSKVRKALVGAGVLHLLLMPLSLLVDDPGGEMAPPLVVMLGVPAFFGLYMLGAAAMLKPGSRGGWGVAVMASGLALVNCLSLPLGIWALVLLFRREVLKSCLGR